MDGLPLRGGVAVDDNGLRVAPRWQASGTVDHEDGPACGHWWKSGDDGLTKRGRSP